MTELEGLAVPEVAPVPPPDSALAIARAGAGTELVERTRARAVIGPSGVEALAIGGASIGGPIESGADAVANTVQTPGMVRRERIGPAGVHHETILACETLPLVAVQWSSTRSDALPTSTLTLRTAPDAPAPTRGHGWIGMAAPGGGVTVAAVSGGAIRPRAIVDGAVRLEVRPGPEACATLLIAHGTEAQAARAVTAAKHLSGQALLSSHPGISDGLTLATGVAEIDDGWAWARERLRTAVSWIPEDASRLWAGLAASAVGEREAAALAFDTSLDDPDERAFLAAAFSTTFGEGGRALELARALVESSRGGAPPAVSPAALVTLAEALHGAAPAKLLAELRTVRGDPTTGRGTAPAGAAGGGRSLPTVSGPDRASWLADLLRGEPPAGTPRGTSSTESELYRRVAAMRDDPERGWTSWRTALAEGLADGPVGPATWDPPARSGEPAMSGVASISLGLAHGVLGLGADAHAGRIRISPVLPGHVRRLAMDGITVGVGRVSLRYEREEGCVRYRLLPTSGPVPPMVVLEARSTEVVGSVRVDGAVADLEPTVTARGSLVSLQLPLDGDREVELMTA